MLYIVNKNKNNNIIILRFIFNSILSDEACDTYVIVLSNILHSKLIYNKQISLLEEKHFFLYKKFDQDSIS